MKYILLLISLLLAAAPAYSSDWEALRRAMQEFHEEDEQGAALCADTLAGVGDHADLFLVLGKANPNIFQQLWDSGPFQTFLNDHPTDAEFPEDDPDAVKQFLDLRLPEFNAGRELDKKQAASLKQSLIVHGARPGRKGGYTALAAVSNENRERLLVNFPYVMGTSGMEQAEALVEKLGLLYTHNAPRAVQTPKYSLLSSAALETLGFTGGLNTSEFNRWLRSDEGVFFFVDPYMERSGGRQVAAHANRARQRYGDFQFELDSKYADRHAWISVYIMDVDELIEFSRIVHPGHYDGIVSNLKEVHDYDIGGRKGMPFEALMDFVDGSTVEMAWQFVRNTSGLEPRFETLRSDLHRFDFAPSDFRAVMQQTLLHRLDRMRRSETARFASAVDTLAHGDARSLRRLLDDEIFAVLGIPNEYELKVPVAVPVQAMRTSNAP
ncbi:MAG: hypothetical protein KDD51_12570 [Bdellovibrionales bacterium]|nr:hypothetical protein [Bdellovibrionales bacterium]